MLVNMHCLPPPLKLLEARFQAFVLRKYACDPWSPGSKGPPPPPK